LFFSHPTRFELQSHFLDVAGRAAAAHTVRREVFTAMLRRLGSYRRARSAYLEEYFSQAELRETAARELVGYGSFEDPDTAFETALRLLEEYARRHVLERETVLAAVSVTLFEIAVAEGFARRPEEEAAEKEAAEEEAAREQARSRRHRRRSAGASEPDERSANPTRWARRVMELGTEAVTRGGLKQRYKSLMKRYHPDVNPGGLRACQRINEAYNLLLAQASDSP
jgi:hypothetical protein